MTAVFDASRDRELIEQASHFFCRGHLCAVPVAEQSADPGYCQSCRDFLDKEAQAAVEARKPVKLPPTAGGGGEPEASFSEAGRRQGAVQKVEGVSSVVGEGKATCSSFSAGGGIRVNEKRWQAAQNGRPKLALPVTEIRRLASDGASSRDITKVLRDQGIKVGKSTVANILKGQGVSADA